MQFSIKDVGVKVGLEIHQQLATGKKLFCNCAPAESDEYLSHFQRRLRASKSELGEFDPAALFESVKSKTIVYYANPQSSCLVEQDEEPPHQLDCDAQATALIIAAALKSNIFSEIYPMRKTVIDGSNTTGFQRTMLISQGGHYTVNGVQIGIQSICLEEDAAKILGEQDSIKKYSLERLGIPLVEIATEPFSVKASEIKEIAKTLGRILRSTKKVRRGLGSIRQDVNVSIRDGHGAVVEVKGVQQLDQLEKIVEYEAKRQHGLLQISKKLKARDWRCEKKDITKLFSNCKSNIIQNAIKQDQRIVSILFKNMAGVFGFSPYEDIRLGKEVAELARFLGIGGVFHSDELPNYGIEESDLSNLRNDLLCGKDDAFLILAAPQEKIHTITDHLVLRIQYIKDHGIPIDTRLATPNGETKFLRPRPGAARMYPETDIPPIVITKDELSKAQQSVPKSWNDSIKELESRYKLNPQLAEQIFDSRYIGLFENIVGKIKTNPVFVASVLCSLITNLERSGLDSNLLNDDDIFEIFRLLEQEKIAKESVEIIFHSIMSGQSKSVEEAIQSTSLESINDESLQKIIQNIVDENKEIITNQKERALKPLMGIAMKQLRGKASGKIINDLLLQSITKKLSDL